MKSKRLTHKNRIEKNPTDYAKTYHPINKIPNPNTTADWSGKQTAKYIPSNFKPTATWTLAL